MVGDKGTSGSERAPEPEYCFSAFQLSPWITHTLVLRTAGDPMAVVPALRSVLGNVDGELPLAAVRPLSDYVRDAFDARHSNMIFHGAFPRRCCSSTVGVCAVVANSVARRTQEPMDALRCQ